MNTRACGLLQSDMVSRHTAATEAFGALHGINGLIDIATVFWVAVYEVLF